MAAADDKRTGHGMPTLIRDPEPAPAGEGTLGGAAGGPGSLVTDSGAGRVRLLDRVRATKAGRVTLKVSVATVGFSLIAVGVALIPLPGPGWLIVLAGLAVLAIEFVWAKHLLRFTKIHLQRWTRWVGRQSWTVRIAIGAVGMVFVGVVVWLSVRMSFGVDLASQVWALLTSA